MKVIYLKSPNSCPYRKYSDGCRKKTICSLIQDINNECPNDNTFPENCPLQEVKEND